MQDCCASIPLGSNSGCGLTARKGDHNLAFEAQGLPLCLLPSATLMELGLRRLSKGFIRSRSLVVGALVQQ